MRKLDFSKLKEEISKRLKNVKKSASSKTKKESVSYAAEETTEFKASSVNETTTKKKKKSNTTAIFAVIVITLIAIGLIVGIFGIVYLKNTIDKAPTFNISDFTNVESSKIYDADGEVIADVGLVSRENVSYDEIPQAFIDAIVAVEDSRFFTHNGFDLPRFVKSIFENLKTLSFSQGASTLTMQLVKGVYFTDDEAGKSRVKSIEYKIQQIYLAIKCEKELSKKSIFEYYVNRINFGAGASRGIKGAAEYYFGKQVNELNLSECAYLAGVVNLPNGFNAYKNYERGLERRNTVLYQMYNHGYISKDEYNLAKSIDLADQLSGTTTKSTKYQAYINEVVDEAIELTGKDPYVVTMNIYTHMNRVLQDQIEAIEAGEIPKVEWPDELMQCAIVSMDNSTGAVIGIGGGRDAIAAKGYSRVSDMYRQPGSSVKPFLSYALAFEYLGWATTHAVEDVPTVYRGTNIQIRNVDRTYRGEVLLKEAVGKSLNIPAYKTLEKVSDSIGSDGIVEYLNSLGLDKVNSDSFDLGYAIGGSSFEVTVEQLAACHSAMINGGYSVVPHTISRIEFVDGTDPYIPDYPKVKVISEQSAYLATNVMEQDVTGPYSNYMQILKRKYEVYAKTGTTNYDDTFVDIGIPEGAAKDKWMVASTSEVTTAVWIGYDSAVDDNCYWTSKKSALNLPGNVNSLILNALNADHTPVNVKKPDGIVSITHVAGLYPYTAPIEGMNEEMIVTGLINKKYHNLKALTPPEVANLTDFGVSNISISDGKVNGNVYWAEYPTDVTINEDGTYEYVLDTKDDHGNPIQVKAMVKKLYNPALFYGPIVYVADYNGGNLATSNDNSAGFSINIPSGATSIDVVGYYQYAYGSSSNKISATISLLVPKSELAAVTNIDQAKALSNKYGLDWQFVPVQITDKNTQVEGNIESCSVDLSSLTIDQAISAVSGIVVNYYYDAPVVVEDNYANCETLKSAYGLDWIIGENIETDDPNLDGKYTVSGGSLAIGETTVYALKQIKGLTFNKYKYIAPTPTTYTVSLSSNEEMGTVSGAGTYNVGDDVTIIANAKEGYHFVSWSNGVTDSPYTFTINENISLTATFAANSN